MVIDYRAINRKTVPDRYPIRRIRSITDKFHGCKVFTTLDFASGFHQLRIDPKDREKTAFSVPQEHFEWLVTPFGWINAPAEFQRASDESLEGILGEEVELYIDDINVHTKDQQRHKELLRKLFQRLSDVGATLQTEKCHLFQSEINYLGFVIDQN